MAKAKKTAQTETSTAIRAIKGFDKDLKCRGFQFSPGETYTHAGPVKACRAGFHAISGHPLEVFGYYPPAGSRFAIVELSGQTDAGVGGDSKIAAEIIKIGHEIGLADLASEAVKWVFERAKWSEGPVVTKPNEGATASGYQGTATASGYQGAATASGVNCGAYATGFFGKVSGVDGSPLHLDRRTYNPGGDDHGRVTHVWAGIVGRDGIEPDTFYTLDEAGQAVKVEVEA